MTTRDAADADQDWWTPHVLIATLGLLVALILRLVPGWSVPLHAWITLTGLVLAPLVVHAGIRAGRLATRARWRDALRALLLAAALGTAAALLMKYGRSHLVTVDDMPFDTPAAARPAPR